MPTREVGGRTIELSNLDKVLWPEVGATKGDLLRHYERVAEHLLRYVRGRPLTLVRCPDEVGEGCWFHKNAGGSVPAWVRTARLEAWKESGVEHVVADEPATLVVLAQLAAVELHAGPSPVDDLDHPADLVLDLDPPGEGRGAAVRQAARWTRALLEDELGLVTFVKSSGSKGFHIHVPLAGTEDVEVVRGFTRAVAEELARRHSEQLTVSQRKKGRGGRIFVDWLRNHPTQTIVAPYSPRARPHATVAVPLDWEELSRGVEPDRHTLSSVPRRLGQREDPWLAMPEAAQSLEQARHRLREIADEQ